MQPKQLTQIYDEKEECTTNCFKPVKGSTEQLYCIEKCNEAFNQRLEKNVMQTYDEIKRVLTKD